MARTMIVGALLSGFLAAGASSAGVLDDSQNTPATAQEGSKKGQDVKKGDDAKKGDDTKKDTKKDAKAEQVTIWILDASGKG